jgi:hypothetical protein
LHRFDQPDLEELFFYLVERAEAVVKSEAHHPVRPGERDEDPLAWR